MKNIIRKILKEDETEKYLNKIADIMKNDYPIFLNMKEYGLYDQLSEKELTYVLSVIFGGPVVFRYQKNYISSNYKVYNSVREEIYFESESGYWRVREFNENGYLTYTKTYAGFWEKREYDENGKVIYIENSKGEWDKFVYNEKGEKIYWEKSDGYKEHFR